MLVNAKWSVHALQQWHRGLDNAVIRVPYPPVRFVDFPLAGGPLSKAVASSRACGHNIAGMERWCAGAAQFDEDAHSAARRLWAVCLGAAVASAFLLGCGAATIAVFSPRRWAYGMGTVATIAGAAVRLLVLTIGPLGAMAALTSVASAVTTAMAARSTWATFAMSACRKSRDVVVRSGEEGRPRGRHRRTAGMRVRRRAWCLSQRRRVLWCCTISAAAALRTCATIWGWCTWAVAVCT